MIDHHGVFDFGGSLFVWTSIAADSEGGAELEAYRLTEPSKFPGGEANDRLGWLHGSPIEHDGRRWILTGPPAIFEADPIPPKQSPLTIAKRQAVP
jgi:hypothetical protein